MMYALLIVGFILLIKGADFFVDGSASIAKLLHVPSVIIGLTIVALGTSAPEAAVSITAALQGNSDIALNNIIGSNLFNLMVVIGVCAAIQAFASHPDILKRDFPISIGLTVLLIVFVKNGVISRMEGLLLLILMALYVFLICRHAKKQPAAEEEVSIRSLSPAKSILFCGIGLAMIILGGNFVVDNASLIAASFGLSDALIGLTIVAIGTSLPELVTSITAARKGQSGLALGNVIGSNIFNIIFILGASSALTPIQADRFALYDCGILLAVSVAIYLFSRTGKRVNRLEGWVCILGYVAYSAYIILR